VAGSRGGSRRPSGDASESAPRGWIGASEDCAISKPAEGSAENDFLVGDPWEGCEDIIAEDLTSWFVDFAQHQGGANRLDLDASQVQRVRDVVTNLLGGSGGGACASVEVNAAAETPSRWVARSGSTSQLGRGWSHAGESEKMSVKSVSTMSSLGTGGCGATSSGRSSPRSSSTSSCAVSTGGPASMLPSPVATRCPVTWSKPLRGWGTPSAPAPVLPGSSASIRSSEGSYRTSTRQSGPQPAGPVRTLTSSSLGGQVSTRSSLGFSDEGLSSSLSPSARLLVEEDVEFLLRGLWLS